jgi:hypothetical protein
MGIAPHPRMLQPGGCNGQIQGVKLHLVAHGQCVPPITEVGDGGWLKLGSAGRDFEIFEVGVGIASTTGMVWTRGFDEGIQEVKLHV